jgi:single-stranded-DNA-specific exonuclease
MANVAADPPEPERPCFLGVTRSVTGKRWESRLDNERLARALAQRHDLPDVVARVMVGRGVRPETAEAYLNPSLRDDLPDPSRFRDMDAAADRLADAVEAGEPVAVFGDYDVDGGTSAALMARVLGRLGVAARIYIPDRCSEGYGPKPEALQTLRAEGHRLVVCVDCGTTAFDPLAAAAAMGLEVVVVDHHTAEPRLPDATAVVNPNRVDETGAHGQMAAVGVTFLLLVALNRVLRGRGAFAAGRREPDLRQWLDLVALGTVCDVVPLTGVNRALVARGLDVMAKRRNPGIAALCDVARLDSAPGPFHLGFMLGPRINAGGRIGRSDMGARLLATDMPGEAERLARELDRLNAERKDMEADVLAQAEAQVAAEGAPEGLVFAAGNGWHPGVIGIVASRLVEKYDMPAFVVGLDDDGTGKGSGRSVRGVDLGSAVIAGRQAGVLREGGGHAMAAGLTVDQSKLGIAREFLRTRLADALAESGYVPAFGFDGAVQPAGATLELVRTLERLGPYGTGNPEPRFALPNVRVQGAQPVGGDGQHVRCTLVGADGARLKAIAFKAAGTALGDALLNADGVARHVAGKLRVDSWSGKDRVQLIVEDAATPG